MKRIFIFFLTLISISFSINAQSVKVTGKLQSKEEDLPVKNAVVALLTKDSVFYKFTRSDASGRFSFTQVQPGDYIFITTHPHFADLVEDVNLQKDTSFQSLNLISRAKMLEEVIIKSGSPIKVRGDTTIFTADSFKVTANANVEELLKKLPGIQVDKDGNIKAMGQAVQKVLVDGEEFFGDDPGMAVKNLRADAVKEVQVFDKKSEQAEFTGIDDGKTQKTINLKLKENSKTGYFGKIDIAAGPMAHADNRYNDNIMFSKFRGKRKFSAFLLNGNTGQDGLSWQDEQKFGGGGDLQMDMDNDDGGIMFYRGGSSDNEPYVNTRNGFITNNNAGILYSDKWRDKQSINLSPKYNNQQYINEATSFTQRQIGDSVLNVNSNETNNVNRHNFKLRGIYDFKIDSMNSLKITANANFYHTESSTNDISRTTGNKGDLKNTSSSRFQTQSDKNALSGSLVFNHKFRKDRRTLSFNGTWNVLNSTGTNMLKSLNESYFNGAPAGSQAIDQMTDFSLSTKDLSAKMVYTEPLSKQLSLLIGYQLSFNYGENNQQAFGYSAGSGKYETAIDSLTNEFRQDIVENIPSLKINFSNKKLKANVGAGVGFTHFLLKDITYQKDYIRDYTNFHPSANIVYTYKPNRSIRFNYDGKTSQPSLNDLQPLRNNNDYFNQYIGNPALKPSFTHSFQISNNFYDFIKDLYAYQALNASFVDNAIVQSRTVNLDSGKTISQPLNTDGNRYLNFYSGVGFKIKKLDTRLDIGPSVSYNRNAVFINGIKSFSTSWNPSLSIGLSKLKQKKYEVNLRYSLSYNSNSTTQSDRNIHYLSNDIYFESSIFFHEVWSFFTNYQFKNQQQSGIGGHIPDVHLVNLRFQRTFKNDEFTTYIAVKDVLNQNIGVESNFYDNTYSEVTNLRLKRYFMLGFAWNFKNKGSQSK